MKYVVVILWLLTCFVGGWFLFTKEVAADEFIVTFSSLNARGDIIITTKYKTLSKKDLDDTRELIRNTKDVKLDGKIVIENVYRLREDKKVKE